MDFSGFGFEADITPLRSLHTKSSSATQSLQQQSPVTDFQFPLLPENTFSITTGQEETLNSDSDRKAFFITNCGSLLGKTIARVALERGHFVAACARAKHLADLNVLLPAIPVLMLESSN
jgi:hypothetical protein